MPSERERTDGLPLLATARPAAQKKSLAASERDPEAREAFRRKVAKSDIKKFIFIDEMGSHFGFTRLYGRATPGQRVVEDVPGKKGENVSTIGAIGLDGVRAALSLPGAIDGETMAFFVTETLAPELKPGEMVFMDNCSIHKVEEVTEAIEAVGARVIFLPTYSPDMNPLENCWSKVKSILRSLKPRSAEELFDALEKAFAAITLQDILGWFKHCGYSAVFE